MIDGVPKLSCLTLAGQVQGAEIITVEGLSDGAHLAPIQTCFATHGGSQCGFCTPGFLIASQALLNENNAPSRDEIAEAIEGNCAAARATSKSLTPSRPQPRFTEAMPRPLRPPAIRTPTRIRPGPRSPPCHPATRRSPWEVIVNNLASPPRRFAKTASAPQESRSFLHPARVEASPPCARATLTTSPKPSAGKSPSPPATTSTTEIARGPSSENPSHLSTPTPRSPVKHGTATTSDFPANSSAKFCAHLTIMRALNRSTLPG